MELNGAALALALFGLFVAIWGWARFEFRLFRRVVRHEDDQDG